VSYAAKRPSLSKKKRALVWAKTDGVCYLCHLPIGSEPWDADHELARELGGSDDLENLFPAHKACHRLKTKRDVKEIAKSNRLRRKHGPVEGRKKTKHPLKNSGRPIPKRRTPWQKKPKPLRPKS
jgi:5-methylcytosine-specific restriction endonuclease McrA